ncbi:CheB methylesterase domain-containing protein [uncultured Tyzzerella sp.]|uniref:CheB methylesterase domain-containing protein n=1 Tax=uncultured Tyzzerella sp. TaxID=2321398 RepID=UPI002941CD3B|nr:CheB methylesterase domain-containing protein [uncultured Tyzzerella sp.]
MEELSIVLFSESAQFLSVTKKSLESYNVKVQKCISNLNEIRGYKSKKGEIFVVQIPLKNKEHSNDIIEFFYKSKLNWVCVGENSNVNFFAMTKGAIENVILKQIPTSTEYKVFIKSLITKINHITEISNLINCKKENGKREREFNKIIAIGASTGGTEAVQSILTNLDENTPPIVIVIHMPPGFTRMYANRLNEICKMHVKEAEDGDILKYGIVYIAPGGYHMRILKNKNEFYISCKEEVKVNGHMPSVDVMFESIAKNVAPRVVSVILTGMGSDGALGILKIKNKGGFTIGQDKDSCVVYGMPKAAKELEAIDVEAPLLDIPKIIMDNI